MKYYKLLMLASCMLMVTVSSNVAARGTVEIVLDNISIQKAAHPPGNRSFYYILTKSIYKEGSGGGTDKSFNSFLGSKKPVRNFAGKRALVMGTNSSLSLGQLATLTTTPLMSLSRLKSQYSLNASSLGKTVNFSFNLMKLNRTNKSIDTSTVTYKEPPDRADGEDTLIDAKIIVWGRDPIGKKFYCSIAVSQSIITYMIVKVAVDLFQQSSSLLLNVSADLATSRCVSAYVN